MSVETEQWYGNQRHSRRIFRRGSVRALKKAEQTDNAIVADGELR